MSHSQGRWVLLILAAAFALVQAACTSRWQSEFVPSMNVAAAPVQADAATVRVREIKPERMEATLASERRLQTSATRPQSEWTAAERDEFKSIILTGLGVTGDLTGVEIIGSSRFQTTARLGLPDGELEAVARKQGANLVVWSVVPGKRDVVDAEPVPDSPAGDRIDILGPDGRRRGSSLTQSGASAGPMIRQVDEYRYVAFFIRERSK